MKSLRLYKTRHERNTNEIEWQNDFNGPLYLLNNLFKIDRVNYRGVYETAWADIKLSSRFEISGVAIRVFSLLSFPTSPLISFSLRIEHGKRTTTADCSCHSDQATFSDDHPGYREWAMQFPQTSSEATAPEKLREISEQWAPGSADN